MNFVSLWDKKVQTEALLKHQYLPCYRMTIMEFISNCISFQNQLMAEITTSSSGKKSGVHKLKKQSTRVDLTPMVDLGFLLITFFVFTTSMSEPKAMKLVMPAGDNDDMPVGESTALTIIPMDNNKIFYYHGDPEKALERNQFGITNYSMSEGIGAIIRQKQKALEQMGKQSKDLILIIKPADASSIGNTVDILDEVLINTITHYALTDLSEGEKKLLATKNIHL